MHTGPANAFGSTAAAAEDHDAPAMPNSSPEPQRQDVDSWCFAHVLRGATGTASVPALLQHGQLFPPEIHFVAESQPPASGNGHTAATQPQLWNCPDGEWEGCTSAPALVFHTSHWKWDLYKHRMPLELPPDE